MSQLFIAIDGPAGAGKSSAARGLAERLQLRYIESGAYYRAVGLMILNENIDLHNTVALEQFLGRMHLRIENDHQGQRVLCNAEDLSEAIRTDRGSEAASLVARKQQVRDFVTAMLRRSAEGGCVMEGRDIGTVVLPDAEFKFFLTASAEVRAQRRAGDANYTPASGDVGSIREALEKRDSVDSKRKAAPLKPADDAIVIDNSHMTLLEVVNTMVNHIWVKN